MLATIYEQPSRPQQKASTAWGRVQGDNMIDSAKQVTDWAQNEPAKNIIQPGGNQPLQLPENELRLPIFDPFPAYQDEDNICPEYPGILYTKPACAEERYAIMSPPQSGFYELSHCQPCMYLSHKSILPYYSRDSPPKKFCLHPRIKKPLPSTANMIRCVKLFSLSIQARATHHRFSYGYTNQSV